ncbi:hypothetical protein K7432_002084 [Basidiobolus ranarum]|uniref:Nuclear pore complex protein Nup88 n=1 Tax=Basidiobolus ranarum TaxID=34480 RepID=A0ABR2X1Z0_9FUNG
MSTTQAPEDWLALLGDHPIFSLNNQELKVWEREQKKLQEKVSGRTSQARIVVRESDLFVAVDSTIRVLNLKECKDYFLKLKSQTKASKLVEPSYKILDVEAIPFPIQKLVINGNGKLMTVVGAHSVMVLTLPRPGYYRIKSQKIPCRLMNIGSYYHRNTNSSPIVKTMWHPLSEGSSHLMVLTKDGILRMYDIASDIEEPEQTFDFTRSDISGVFSGGNTFSAESDGKEAVSFCFGSPKKDWGPFTVYVLMKNGDIYSLCPVMPKTSVCSKGLLSNLLALVQAQQIPEFLNRSVFTDDVEITQESLQSHWINEVVNNAKLLNTNVLAFGTEGQDLEEEHVHISQPNSVRAQPFVQGPYLLQPAPVEISGDDVEASDILYMDADPVGILAIAFGDGKIDICLEVEPVVAQWDVGQDLVEDENLPVLAVYETINLGLIETFGENEVQDNLSMSIQNYSSLVLDPVYPDTFYCYHEAGVHSIVTRTWQRDLQKAVQSNVETGISQFLKKNIPSDVYWIVNTRPLKSSQPAPIVGLAVVSDVYLSYSLLIMTSSFQFIGTELSLRVQIPSISTHLKESESSEGASYIPLLPLPTYTPPEKLEQFQGLTRQPRIVLPPNHKGKQLKMDEESLRFLGQMVERLRDDAHVVVNAHNSICQRINLQIKEFNRQLAKLSEVSKVVHGELREKEEQVDQKVDKLRDNQKKLTLRMDTLLQSLIDQHEPTLSQYETKYFGELKSIEHKLRGPSGYESRMHKITTQLDQLKRDLQAKATKLNPSRFSTAPKYLSEAQLSKIHQALAQETKLITATCEKIDTLESRIAKMAI